MATNRNLIPDEDLRVVGAPPTTSKPAQPVKQWTPDDLLNAYQQNVDRVNREAGNSPSMYKEGALANVRAWAEKMGIIAPGRRDTEKYGPFAPPPTVEKGVARLDKIMATAPGFAGSPASHDWDHWILSLPFDPSDLEYNAELAKHRQAAIKRLRDSGNDVTAYDPEAKREADKAAERAGAKDTSPGRVSRRLGVVSPDLEASEQPDAERTAELLNFTRANTIVVLGPDGREKRTLTPWVPGTWTAKSATAPREPGERPGTWLDDEPDKDAADQWTSLDAIRSGELVYVADEPTETPAAFNKGTLGFRPKYMTKADFHTMVRQEGPELVKAIQAAHGLKPTGYITDTKTRALMKSIADDAATYAQAGMRVGLDFFMFNGVAGGGDDDGSGGGSGYRRYGGGGGGYGGGGGGGGGGIPLGTAKRYLNQYMLQYAGREANESEVGAFAQAISGAMGSADFDAQQYTIDWVRMVAGKEVGAYQAATDYYQAALSALGGLGGAA